MLSFEDVTHHYYVTDKMEGENWVNIHKNNKAHQFNTFLNVQHHAWVEGKKLGNSSTAHAACSIKTMLVV